MANTVLQDQGYGGSVQSVAGIMQLLGENERLRQKRNAMTEIVRALDSDDSMALQKAIGVAANYQNQYDNGLAGILQRVAATQSRPSAPGVEALTEVGLPLAQAQSGLERNKAYSQYMRGEGRQTYRRDPLAAMKELQFSMAALKNQYQDDPQGLEQDANYQWLMGQAEQLRNATTKPQGPALPPSGNTQGLPQSDMRTGEAIESGRRTGQYRPGSPGAPDQQKTLRDVLAQAPKAIRDKVQQAIDNGYGAEDILSTPEIQDLMRKGK